MMTTEQEVREVARLLSAGGCDDRIIAQAVSQCARTVFVRQYPTDHRKCDAMRQRLVDELRSEGWFE